MVEFITENPFTKGLRAGEARSEQRRAAELADRAGEFNLSEAQRRADQERTLDEAYRRAMRTIDPSQGRVQPAPQQPAPAPAPGTDRGLPDMEIMPLPAPSSAATPASPNFQNRAIQELSRVAGGGRAAFDLRQKFDANRERDETAVMQLLANPQTAHLGKVRAQQIGMNIPPQLASDTAFWQYTAIAKDLYPDDPGAGQRFVSAAKLSGAQDIQTAVQAGIAAAGQPRKAGPKPVAGQFVRGDDGTGYNIQPGHTVARPITTETGEPLRVQGFGTGGAGRSGGNLQLIESLANWKAASEGRQPTPADHLVAFAEFQQAKTNPTARAQLVVRLMDVISKSPGGSRLTLEEVQQQARKVLAAELGEDAATAMPPPDTGQQTEPPPPIDDRNWFERNLPNGFGGRPPAGAQLAPPELAGEPDGTVVEDDQGQRWVKQGPRLIPQPQQ